MRRVNMRLYGKQGKFPDEVEIDLQKTKALPKDEIQLSTSAKEAELEKEEVANDIIEKQPLVAQKKGQNEFVSFVEPVDAKQTKSVPSLEKRRLSTSSDNVNFMPTYSSNLLMIAVGTVLVVGMMGTIVGGGIYLKRRRDTPDDAEYAPYAGTGPGFKKGKLHHYQQAKQKIICGDDAPAGLESEGEDDGADDENNFSVYECPGLAPTGDIEVCNPNFAAQP
uniref:APP_amyloid domain-containing protein n=1 Tax=Heterorhabditis bacteriophora TaxID=37862 RepID=A0A1I7XLF7_HETBA